MRDQERTMPAAYVPGPLRPAVAEAMLRAAGVRMTPQRRVVLNILDGNRTHPTAAAIVKQAGERLGGVSVATIYNTLDKLVELGLVRRLDVMESSTHFDPDTSVHHHFVCRQCHRVLDIPAAEVGGSVFQGGYLVEDVILKGICDQCGSDKSNRKGNSEQ